VRPRYWLPPAMLAHVDGGGVFRQAGKRRGEMRTDVESALASGLWGTWGARNPDASETACSVVSRGSKSGDVESLSPRSLFTKHSV
jgi:hypothetical protein